MRIKSSTNITFKHEELVFDLTVLGHVSISLPPVFMPDKPILVLSKSEQEYLFTVEKFQYEVKHGFWEPTFILIYGRGIITPHKTSWSQVQKDIQQTFLSGYLFFWKKFGNMPLDWTPPKFKEIFDVAL